jgi:hypothetical protein
MDHFDKGQCIAAQRNHAYCHETKQVLLFKCVWGKPNSLCYANLWYFNSKLRIPYLNLGYHETAIMKTRNYYLLCSIIHLCWISRSSPGKWFKVEIWFWLGALCAYQIHPDVRSLRPIVAMKVVRWSKILVVDSLLSIWMQSTGLPHAGVPFLYVHLQVKLAVHRRTVWMGLHLCLCAPLSPAGLRVCLQKV